MKGKFPGHQAAVIFVFMIFCPQASLAQQKISEVENSLFDSVNRERAERKLPPLKWDEGLAHAARKHAELMAQDAKLEHQLPGEADLKTRASEAGARFSRITENIGSSEVPGKFHDGWMHSVEHRENILDGAADSVGIAIVEGIGKWFAVEDFARAVKPLSIEEQEKQVEQLIAAQGLRLRGIGADARKSCELNSDYGGATMPKYVAHYETPNISQLPDLVEKEIQSHHYKSAAVGACPQKEASAFTRFRIVVLFY